MDRSPGADLALMLLRAFRGLVDDVSNGLERAGHPGVRAADEFALRAIAEGAETASELGRRLSITKQAAAQRIATLEQLGYVEREPDPADARRRRLLTTSRGREMMALGGALLDDIRDRWAANIGRRELERIEQHLRRLTADYPFPADATS
ncbi:MarR family transcriptional regulator [Pseudonocardia kujensis]|uniref:MarR family winged helix-turn-helix transcriptional regulator n=1 Tax=Pseudonocardia kujensis TaxID=1128675 RepID=UPI001E54F2C3|nr:helix-turn-helix domain-containing protein [Pseudonocardia kujensis]MCE0763307.1 MarR family transcriptional regulator [Pseudonocardia kujensis]